MSLSNTRAKHVSSIVSTMMLALAFALVIDTIAIAPAFSQNHNKRHRQQERAWHGHARHNQHARHGRARQYNRRVYQPYRYYSAPPVYRRPPPVIYPPYWSPGISLFFPFYFR